MERLYNISWWLKSKYMYLYERSILRRRASERFRMPALNGTVHSHVSVLLQNK